jgi:hypothetical protein
VGTGRADLLGKTRTRSLETPLRSSQPRGPHCQFTSSSRLHTRCLPLGRRTSSSSPCVVPTFSLKWTSGFARGPAASSAAAAHRTVPVRRSPLPTPSSIPTDLAGQAHPVRNLRRQAEGVHGHGPRGALVQGRHRRRQGARAHDRAHTSGRVRARVAGRCTHAPMLVRLLWPLFVSGVCNLTSP